VSLGPDQVEVELPNGYRIGDAIFSRIDLLETANDGSPVQIAVGDRGTVVGPSSTDREKEILCRFGNYVLVTLLAEEVELEVLPGGFRVRDIVISTIELNDVDRTLSVGDRGTVIGSSKTAPDTQILCQFENFGSVSLGPDQVEVETLGHSLRGLVLICKIDRTDSNGTLAVGDRGIGIGPSTVDPDKEILCRFEKYTSVSLLPDQVELELPGGYRIGDIVVSKTRRSDGPESVKKGEQGIVLGLSPTHRDTHIQCTFPNFANVCLIASDLSLEPSQFRIGDVVISKKHWKGAAGTVHCGDPGIVIGVQQPGKRISCKFEKCRCADVSVAEVKREEAFESRSNPMRTLSSEDWGITGDQLVALSRQVASRYTDKDENPNVYELVDGLIKPLCMAQHVSYSILQNPGGLRCETFVSHAWCESYLQFVADMQDRCSDFRTRVFWVCFVANPQTWPKGNLKRFLGVNPHHSPFAIAICKCDDFLVVRNNGKNIYWRLWCCVELAFASSEKKAVQIAGTLPPSTTTSGAALLKGAKCTDKDDNCTLRQIVKERFENLAVLISNVVAAQAGEVVDLGACS